MNNTLADAQALYEEGKFVEALNICIKLLNEEYLQDFEHNLLVLKLHLMLIGVDIDDKDKAVERVSGWITRARDCVKSEDEEIRIIEEFYDTLEKSKEKWINSILNEFAQNPKKEPFLEYRKLIAAFAEIKFNFLTVCLFADDNRVEVKSPDSRFTDKVLNEMEYRSVLNGFSNMKAEYETYRENSNPELVVKYIEVLGRRYAVLSTFADEIIRDAKKMKEFNANELCDRLKMRAEIEWFLLDATVIVTGQREMSYVKEIGDRQKRINIIKKIYTEIKSINGQYIIPDLPSIQPVDKKLSACYIATAVYGSYDCPQVWTLRRFRDYTLANSWYGRLFIRIYYAVSPVLVKWFGNKKWFERIWRPFLERMVKRLNEEGVDNSPYVDKEW